MADPGLADATPGPPEPFVAGLSHRSAPGSLRDRLIPDELGGTEPLLGRLAELEVQQAMVLATCDRVEIVGADPAPAAAAATALALLAERTGLSFSTLQPHAYLLIGEAALRHLFLVATALDSVVVGEPQILGQLKRAHRLAVEAGCVGPELEAILQDAYAAAKRVRSETGLAEQPVSLATVATRLARNLHGELSQIHALLIGFGEMGAAIARSLQAQGLTGLSLTTASPVRGSALAQELGAHHRPIVELAAALDHADIVLAAVSAAAPVLDAHAVKSALRRRRRRPMLLIDLGIPGDIEPEVDKLEDVFLYTLEDLERISAGGRARREASVAAATAIVEEELERQRRASAARAALPAMLALRRHFEQVRAEVLARAGGLDANLATRLLINRLLHEPSTALKALSAEPAHSREERRRIERTLLKLFGIERRYGASSAPEDGGPDAQS
ncbi:MAG TPA: glutamyl-tRNA reductase [Alphaproteobacteria bacterium]|nr:glutamyl-tRNA reductase [Alphaproteobacteria bacterium]